MARKIWKWFLQGIALVAPAALTIALLVWLGAWWEKAMGNLIRTVIPVDWYFDGLGLLTGIAATLGIGLLANSFLIRMLVEMFERILDRIPLVKPLFQAFKDVARLLAQEGKEKLGEVVAVELGDLRLVGFVMQQKACMPGDFDDTDERVAVYVAMSYQLGGFTVYVRRDQITPLDVTTDTAMRAVLTAGSLCGGTKPAA